MSMSMTTNGVKRMTIENNAITELVMVGDPMSQLTFALDSLIFAKEQTKRIQRPMVRKFDSLIAKVRALKADMERHIQYCEELEERNEERKQTTRMRQFAKKFAGNEYLGDMAAMIAEDPDIMNAR